MKWILNYVDVKFGDPLSEVEDRCSQGWEPFAITWVPSMSSLGPALVESKIQRFWFKKLEGCLDVQIFPLILKEDMEELLAYASNNDQCSDEEFEEIDKIAKRWNLSR